MIVYFAMWEKAEAGIAVMIIDCCRSEYFLNNCIKKKKRNQSNTLRICKEKYHLSFKMLASSVSLKDGTSTHRCCSSCWAFGVVWLSGYGTTQQWYWCHIALNSWVFQNAFCHKSFHLPPFHLPKGMKSQNENLGLSPCFIVTFT